MCSTEAAVHYVNRSVIMSQETADSTTVTVEPIDKPAAGPTQAPIDKPAAGPTQAQLQAQQLQEAQALQVCNCPLVLMLSQFQNCAGYDGHDGC